MTVISFLTVSGNLTAAPRAGSSTAGATWIRFRVATTSRFFDRAESQWRDGDTVFLDVVCWRRLAENVIASGLGRGDRVLVSGRLKQRSYEDDRGVRHTVLEMEAEAMGPDLSRAPARVVATRPGDGAGEPALRGSGDAAAATAVEGTADAVAVPAEDGAPELAAVP